MEIFSRLKHICHWLEYRMCLDRDTHLSHFGRTKPLEEGRSGRPSTDWRRMELYSRCAVFPFKILSHTRLCHGANGGGLGACLPRRAGQSEYQSLTATVTVCSALIAQDFCETCLLVK